ncbi:MAG: CsgG/HfaB family protein [Treponema sp.]|nr:CsgG/HfaB family protein [Treponema sp.]
MPIAKRLVAVLLVLLVFTACKTAPPSSADTSPVALSDSSPVPVEETLPGKAANLREALELSSRVIMESLVSNASVAVISVSAGDPFEGEYALEELTLLLVRAQKFRIVDRRNLDVIRAEQQFQLSGEVDDETAVSIGHLIGAAFVITGGISPWESAKHLRLRVLDVETGRICAMTSISYGGAP